MTQANPVLPGADGAPERAALPRAATTLVLTRGVSSVGSTLTAFGLDIWVFRSTGSYAAFVCMAVLSSLPVLLFAPFAGAMSDRFDKRRLLVVADLVSAVAVLGALALFLAQRLSVPAVGACVLLLGVAGELRWSATSTLLSELVPRDGLAKANGLQQSFRGANVMLGPMLGAIGYDAIGLTALLCADLLSYAVSLAGLRAIRAHARAAQGRHAGTRESFMDDLTLGFRWVGARAGFRRLLAFFMAANVGASIFMATFSPYVLSFSGSRTLAAGMGVLGAGAFIAGLALGRRGRFARPESAIAWATLAFGLALIAWGMARSPAASWLTAFAIGALQTIVMTASQTAWQMHVPRQIQGKVFAVRTVVSFGMAPVALLGSVPLAAFVFAPLVRAGAPAAVAWGGGQSGALGLMVSACGAGIAVMAAFVLARGGIRLELADGAPAAS